jgi:hypothetical protein
MYICIYVYITQVRAFVRGGGVFGVIIRAKHAKEHPGTDLDLSSISTCIAALSPSLSPLFFIRIARSFPALENNFQACSSFLAARRLE